MKKKKKKIEKKKSKKKNRKKKKLKKKDDGRSSLGSEISAPLGFTRPSDDSGVHAPFGPLVDKEDCTTREC